MLEFRLAYQGILQGEGDSKHKHEIRRYLHKQLLNLWKIKEPLKSRGNFYSRREESGNVIEKNGIQLVADAHQMGNKRFVPVVRREWGLTCALDVLILRRDHFPLITSGDLDNRIKTLFDALRIPDVGQYCEGDEDPLYCLLEDDKLVAELRVTADLLTAPPEQIVESPKKNIFGDQTVSVNHALVLIHVLVKPTSIMHGNLDFV